MCVFWECTRFAILFKVLTFTFWNPCTNKSCLINLCRLHQVQYLKVFASKASDLNWAKRTSIQFQYAIYFTRNFRYPFLHFLGSFYLRLALFVYSIKVCALFLGIKKGAVLFCNVYEFFRDNRFLSTLHCKCAFQ